MPTEPATFANALRSVRLGIWSSLLTIFFGFGIGAAFGAAEESLKGDLKDRAQAVLATAYKGDATKMLANIDKSWAYYKRAHLHGGAIGTASLACAFLLAFMLRPPALLRSLTALSMGLGGLAYSIYWLLAGYRAPELGSTSAAKDSLEWLAVPSAGMVLVGLFLVLVFAFWEWGPPAKTAK